jgi:hypothetical protein
VVMDMDTSDAHPIVGLELHGALLCLAEAPSLSLGVDTARVVTSRMPGWQTRRCAACGRELGEVVEARKEAV